MILIDECCLLYVCCVSLFAFYGSECVPFTLFTTLENEEGSLVEEAYFNSGSFQDQGQELYQGKPSQCLLLHLSLSIMHVLLLKFYKKLFKQKLFLMWLLLL